MSSIMAGPPMVRWGFYEHHGTGHRLLRTEIAEDLEAFWGTSRPLTGVEIDGHQLVFQPGSWRFRVSNLTVLGSGVVSLRVQEGPLFVDQPLTTVAAEPGKPTNLSGSMLVLSTQVEARVSLVYEGLDPNEFVILYPGTVYLEQLS